jgi:eukaryotic-like serine/threonine-protein kinase
VCTLIGRAAVVPSNGARTLTVGVLAALPVLVGTYHAHARMGAAAMMPAPIAASQIGNWLAFGLLLSTTISRVIYGLSARVQEAQRLGQYTLERKIGAGAMGEVYLARHALLRRPTAVKLLAPGRTGQEALQRFEREVQTTSGLRHPHTVAIYDYGRTPEGIFYYAMEYLDGVDLEHLITSDGPQPEGRVIRILRQVAGALSEAHTAGLIHRDIKPSNILLCDHGHEPDFAKVLDFGLVKQSDNGTGATAAGAAVSGAAVLTGTPLYMSPEAITTPTTIDGRADLYALGAVAYALLTGAPPFSGHTAVEVYGHHLHTPVEPPSLRRDQPIDRALESLVLSCLAKDRQARPASAAILEEQLAGCPVVPWSTAQARAWWDQRGPALRAARPAAAPTESGATVVVDLHGRRLD